MIAYECDCCMAPSGFLTKSQLTENYQIPESELKGIEEKAIKDRREAETKQAAEEL